MKMPAADSTSKVPSHPERICWGCDNYCPAHDLRCGSRTRHPAELSEENEPELPQQSMSALAEISVDQACTAAARDA